MHSPIGLITPDNALTGRSNPIAVDRHHLTLGTSMMDPPAAGTETAYVAMGCFWGAERKFFELGGVVCTSVGYQGGFTPNPTYQEVCSGKTGHAEAVKVVFNPATVSYREILQRFYENHDPTQGFRQGADIGTQYRSAIYFLDTAQERVAQEVTELFAAQLRAAGYGPITTEIAPAGPFYLAEEYHQQYLVANPNGYCGLGGTGVSCPVGLLAD
ncbi:MAG TPA: peptide-methionine (S)-S-oxide reductase MsrA [Acidimicrobiales bacterium]|nr:peptide-methionine (S)-S-oxide reductase MsrA [Acidimicrobiales bacterium]